MFGDEDIEDRLEDIELSGYDEEMTALDFLEELDDEELRRVLSDAFKIWEQENKKK